MKTIQLSLCGTALLLLTACGSSKNVQFLEAYAPQESSLNMVKITDESNNSVTAGSSSYINKYQVQSSIKSPVGVCAKSMYRWFTHKTLAISPDGKKLAYVTRSNGQDNIMVRSTSSQGMATQRTFRNVHSFSWGNDGKLYFSDLNGNNLYISAVNAEQDSMMTQLTNGNVVDTEPVISSDGKMLFFTRQADGSPSIWSLNRENGTLTSCARGFNPCLIPGNNEAFYCTRNASNGRSEIWYVDYVKGQESLILSNENTSFTNPQLSPDGKWIACVGNTQSAISKRENLDIFVVRTDGSNLTQLTWHPSADTCPVWAKDGRSIYFISARANKNESYNIWRMNFNME